AFYGGVRGYGTVFVLRSDGSGFTNLYNFAGADDGIGPGSLSASGNRLYGTAQFGGSSGGGTVFTLNKDGTGFATLYGLTGDSCLSCPNANADGANPSSGLLLTNNSLYGAAQLGSTSGNGTLFTLTTTGTLFTNLYAFSSASPCCPLLNGD